jgi:DNA modification methylase
MYDFERISEQERTKHVHRLHPYLGKFIPQLVEVFLDRYFKPGDTIFDPFCGSGTALVQANEMGINSIGCDIAEFNILLSRVKTAEYNISDLNHELFDICDRVESTCKGQTSLFNLGLQAPDNFDTDNVYLNKWFSKNVLNELLCYKYFIDNSDYIYKDIMRIILCRTARSCRLVKHYELDFPRETQIDPYWCFKHSRTCKPTEDSFGFLQRYTNDTFKRIKEFSKIKTDASVTVEYKDSRNISIPKVNGIITSPPYVGVINYHDQHVYAYNLLDLNDLSGLEIGPAFKGTSKKAVTMYKEAMIEVFKNTLNFVERGGTIIVIANDKHDIYSTIANSIGVEVENVFLRRVTNRTGLRKGVYYESIFIWKN